MAQFIKVVSSDESADDIWINVGNIVMVFMYKGSPAMRMNNGLILVAMHETVESLMDKIKGVQENMPVIPEAFLKGWGDDEDVDKEPA